VFGTQLWQQAGPGGAVEGRGIPKRLVTVLGCKCGSACRHRTHPFGACMSSGYSQCGALAVVQVVARLVCASENSFPAHHEYKRLVQASGHLGQDGTPTVACVRWRACHCRCSDKACIDPCVLMQQQRSDLDDGCACQCLNGVGGRLISIPTCAGLSRET
jgi:hypothetical protein